MLKLWVFIVYNTVVLNVLGSARWWNKRKNNCGGCLILFFLSDFPGLFTPFHIDFQNINSLS